MNKIVLSLLSFCMFSLVNAQPLPQEVMTALMLKRCQSIYTINDAIVHVSSGSRIVNCLSAGYALPDHRMLKKIFDGLDEDAAWDLSQIEDDYQNDYRECISTIEQLRSLQNKYKNMSEQDSEGMGNPFKEMHIVYMDGQRPHIAHIG